VAANAAALAASVAGSWRRRNGSQWRTALMQLFSIGSVTALWQRGFTGGMALWLMAGGNGGLGGGGAGTVCEPGVMAKASVAGNGRHGSAPARQRVQAAGAYLTLARWRQKLAAGVALAPAALEPLAWQQAGSVASGGM